MSDSHLDSERDRDEKLARQLHQAIAAAQQAIQAAVAAGLKVTIGVEAVHHGGHHFPEPLLEVEVERIIRLR